MPRHTNTILALGSDAKFIRPYCHGTVIAQAFKARCISL